MILTGALAALGTREPATTPAADAVSNLVAGEAPLHRLRPAGIGAGGDDAEIAARLLQRRRIDVGLGGRFLDGGHLLGAMGERVFEKVPGALAAIARLYRRRCCT
jgi:hypothetical protein